MAYGLGVRVAALVVVLAAAAGPALAQGVEEIVVTARKRAETLQEIPIAISAFTAEQIEHAGYQNLQDIALEATGIQFNQMAGYRAGRQDASIRFRGMTIGSWLANQQLGSLFVDGVFVLGGAQTIGLSDLERVEVIKGPQSAYFGRNTFSGAVNYITRNPSLSSYEGRIDVNAATYDQYDVSLSHGGPIVADKIGYFIDGRLFHKGGMYTATDGGKLGEQASKSVSGVLYAEPSDRLKVKARFFYQRDDDGPDAGVYLAGRSYDTCRGTSVQGRDAAGNAVTLHPVGYICGQIPNPGQPGAPIISKVTSLTPSVLAARPQFLKDTLTGISPIPGVPKMYGEGLARDLTRFTLVGDYAFADGTTLEVTGAYNTQYVNWIEEYDRTNSGAWYSEDPQSAKDWSAGVRITSPDKRRLRWLAGAEYFHENFLTNGGGGLTVATCGSTGLLPTGLCAGPPIVTVAALTGGDLAWVYGLYASVSYDITPQLTADLEGRYQSDRRNRQGYAQAFKDWIPRAILSYKPSGVTTVYGSYSRGVVPGALNSFVIGCNPNPMTTPYIDTATGQSSTASECAQLQKALGAGFANFTPSQALDAFELGLKQGFWQDRAHVNLSGYYYKWHNQLSGQLVSYYKRAANGTPTPSLTAVTTSGSSDLYGLELESTLKLTEHWDAALNVGYNHNQYTSLITTAIQGYYGSPNVQGHQAPRYPGWQGSLVSTYQDHLTAAWDWFVRGDVMYFGKAYADESNLAWTGAYTLVNAHLGVQQDRLRLELYVRNMFDTKTWAAATRFTDFSVPGSFVFSGQGISLAPQDRRTFGLHATSTF